MDNSSKSSKFKPTALRLMDQVREVLRFHHYAYSTEKAYVDWILKYIRFNGKRHPKDMGKAEIERFLSHLAVNRQVSASTQNQAYNAILFLYKEVLDLSFDFDIRARRSSKAKQLPTVMSRDEVACLIQAMDGTTRLMAELMYGSGMRSQEVIRLRIHDIDIDNMQIYIRNSKGGKDRKTILPSVLCERLEVHISRVIDIHQNDLASGYGSVYLPPALGRKYPNAAMSPGWQYAFPSIDRSTDPRTGKVRRHHIHKTALQKAVKKAATKAGIVKRVSPHTLRHTFATHLLENGVNIRILQTLLGHKDVRTTEIYTHVMQRSYDNVKSPLEDLPE